MKTKTNQPDEVTPPNEDANLTALQAENEQLRATLRIGEAHRQITGELARAGARSPELLFDSVKADLQFADDGTLANAEAILKRLMRRFPEQFGGDSVHESIDGGAGRVAPPTLTKEALAKMKPAEIASLDWSDVRRVLAS